MVPLGDSISASSREPGTHCLPHPHHPTFRPWLDHCCLVSNGREGAYSNLCPHCHRNRQSKKNQFLLGFLPKVWPVRWGDLIGGASSHDLSQAAKKVGKKTCLAFLALCPVMGNSPIIGKNFTINGKGTPDGAMAIIACDKVDEWEGEEGGMIEDIWRTVCWSGKRRL